MCVGTTRSKLIELMGSGDYTVGTKLTESESELGTLRKLVKGDATPTADIDAANAEIVNLKRQLAEAQYGVVGNWVSISIDVRQWPPAHHSETCIGPVCPLPPIRQHC